MRDILLHLVLHPLFHMDRDLLPTSPSNDSDTQPLPRIRPDVCVHNNTNLHSVATYAIADDHQQRASIKAVAHGAIETTHESYVRTPTSFPTVTTNSKNNMDSTQSNSCKLSLSLRLRLLRILMKATSVRHVYDEANTRHHLLQIPIQHLTDIPTNVDLHFDVQ
ncbi:hypothetical protein Tco_1249393, partial [Tanacetum coccineum]